MRIKQTLFTLCVIIAFSFRVSGQETGIANKKIVVLGSSVAAGWVTSYQERYDMKNGYAYRLARLLEPRGWEVINISIPGFDTKSTIERFEGDVLPLEPGYVIIGLSMSNEGLETGDPDSVSLSYETGIRKLISLCRENNIRPVVGLCYSNDNYTEEQYAYLKKMNRLIASWDIPSINFLGVLDDGHGHFPEGFTFDPNHPDDRGHEEMFYAIVPDLFDALQDNKTVFDVHKAAEKMLDIRKKEIIYVPGELMHSFTLSFNFKYSGASVLLNIATIEGKRTVSIAKDGVLRYDGQQLPVKVDNLKPHKLSITHQYLYGKTIVYLDGEAIYEVDEQVEPIAFSLGNMKSKLEVQKLLIYRAALNPEEIEMLNRGDIFNASLEVASLFTADDFELKDNILTNHTLSLGNAVIGPADVSDKVQALKKKILEAQELRENELQVEHRQAIEINPSRFDQYVGTYEIEPGDNMLVVREGDALYLDDHGRKAEILPEGDDQFFIRYPGDILVIFQRDEQGQVSGLIFSINGQEMKANKIIK